MRPNRRVRRLRCACAPGTPNAAITRRWLVYAAAADLGPVARLRGVGSPGQVVPSGCSAVRTGPPGAGVPLAAAA